MKINKRTLTITIILGVFVLFIAGILVAVNFQNLKPHLKVAFYDLNDTEKNALTKELETFTNKKGKKLLYRFTELNSSAELETQLQKKKYDIVFTQLGKDAEDAAQHFGEKKNIAFATTVLDGTTISIHQAALYNKSGSVSALPLLIDHHEIDIDRTVLAQYGIKTIATWNDIESFAVKAQKNIKSPIVFAGGDGETFLGIFGALVESLSGREAYDSAAATIQEATAEALKKGTPLTSIEYSTLIKNLSEKEGTPFYAATRTLSRWYKKGLLNSETFNMTPDDVTAFMEAKNAAVCFMTLSQHRNIEHEIIERYSSIYYPSERVASLRYFTAPLVCAIPLSKNANAHWAIQKLVSAEVQESLSREAGLAPVQANCRVADHQADDVRYWVAATNSPLPSFGKKVFSGGASLKIFAGELGSYIRFLPQ